MWTREQLFPGGGLLWTCAEAHVQGYTCGSSVPLSTHSPSPPTMHSKEAETGLCNRTSHCDKQLIHLTKTREYKFTYLLLCLALEALPTSAGSKI